jgi:hypothetical protein
MLAQFYRLARPNTTGWFVEGPLDDGLSGLRSHIAA